MNKLLSLIALCGCTALFTACGNDGNSNNSSQQATTTPQEQTTPVVQTDETKENKTTPEVTEKNNIAATESTESNTLVVYFSRTGNTEKIAEYLIELTNADSYVIEAAVPYTDEDIEYNNASCRANKEQNDKSVRPEIANPIASIDSYDTIFLGYPIWWGQEPRIIDTFLESYDFSEKTVIPFCTSGSSGIGTSEKNISELVTIGTQLEGKRFPAGASEDEVKEWYDTLNLN
jgi:flavodoxin